VTPARATGGALIVAGIVGYGLLPRRDAAPPPAVLPVRKGARV
jgi:hypothetical protein